MTQQIPNILVSASFMTPALFSRRLPVVAGCLIGSSAVWLSNKWRHQENPEGWNYGLMPYFESLAGRVGRLSAALGASSLVTLGGTAILHGVRRLNGRSSVLSVRSVLLASGAQMGIALVASCAIEIYRNGMTLPSINVRLPTFLRTTVNPRHLDLARHVARVFVDYVPPLIASVAPALLATDRSSAVRACALAALCLRGSERVGDYFGVDAVRHGTGRLIAALAASIFAMGAFTGARDLRSLRANRNLAVVLGAQVGVGHLLRVLDERMYERAFWISLANTAIVGLQYLTLLAPAALAPNWKAGLQVCGIGLACLGLSQRAASREENHWPRSARLLGTFAAASALTRYLPKIVPAASGLALQTVTRLHFAQFLAAWTLTSLAEGLRSRSREECTKLLIPLLAVAPALFAANPLHGLAISLVGGAGAVAARQLIRRGPPLLNPLGQAVLQIAGGGATAFLIGRVTKLPVSGAAAIIATQFATLVFPQALQLSAKLRGVLLVTVGAVTTRVAVTAPALLAADRWQAISGTALSLTAGSIARLLQNRRNHHLTAVMTTEVAQLLSGLASLGISTAMGYSLRASLAMTAAQLVAWGALQSIWSYGASVDSEERKAIVRNCLVAAAALCLLGVPTYLGGQPLHTLLATALNGGALFGISYLFRRQMAGMQLQQIVNIGTSVLTGTYFLTRGLATLTRRQWSWQVTAGVAAAHAIITGLAALVLKLSRGRSIDVGLPDNYRDLDLVPLIRALGEYTGRSCAKAIAHFEGDTYAEAAVLRDWLRRLGDTANFANPRSATGRAFAARIVDYLNYAAKDDDFRGSLISCAQEGVDTCGDRMALSVLRVGLAYRLARCPIGDLKGLAALYARGWWALHLLEAEAQAKISEIEGRNEHCDRLEVYLGYPVYLRNRLSIPIDPIRMLYPSHLVPKDLYAAEMKIRNSWWEGEAFYAYLVQHDKWIQALRQRYPDECAAIDERVKQMMDQGDYVGADGYRKEEWAKLTAQALRFSWYQPFLDRLWHQVFDHRRMILAPQIA